MLWICVADLVAYAPGVPACPQCGSNKHVEQGSDEHLALLATRASAEPVAASGEEPSDA